MTKMLYMEDCYMKEFVAKVTNIEKQEENICVELDQTAFYPESGGQLGDFGTLKKGDEEFKVLDTKKIKGKTLHFVDKEGLAPGDQIKGTIDWGRRYKLMRYHTAAHVVSTSIHNETKAEITGNQLYLDKARVDYNLEEFDREAMMAYESKINEILSKDLPVTIALLPREEAFKIPSLVKLQKMLPESIKTIRVISIDGFDKQACGGTHVKNISEIGQIEISKLENKGKSNRRMYFRIKE